MSNVKKLVVPKKMNLMIGLPDGAEIITDVNTWFISKDEVTPCLVLEKDDCAVTYNWLYVVKIHPLDEKEYEEYLKMAEEQDEEDEKE